MNTLHTSLRGHSETRWSSKASTIRALHSQIREVFKVLNDTVAKMLAKPETFSTAQCLLHQIDFQFSCTQVTWNRILNHTDKAKRPLQSKNLTVLQVSKLLVGLKGMLRVLREGIAEEYLIYAKKIKLHKNWQFPQVFHQVEAIKEIHNKAMNVGFCLKKIIKRKFRRSGRRKSKK
jgi:hypothetical protein